MTTDFVEFPKIARYSREVIVSEKIDGTNACVFIGDDGQFLTGSRTRWITPDADNYGFSRWAHEHKDELLALGPGRHFGEWWGSGCQRGYDLPKGEKRFSLFNSCRFHTSSWNGLLDGGDYRLPPGRPPVEPGSAGMPPMHFRR